MATMGLTRETGRAETAPVLQSVLGRISCLLFLYAVLHSSRLSVVCLSCPGLTSQ